jgi:integrase
VVQERLGHAQINVTIDTYSHVLPGMQREAATKCDELLAVRSRSDGTSQYAAAR